MTYQKLSLAVTAIFTTVLGAPGLVAQDGNAAITTETFVRPPAEIADAVLAPRHLNVTLGNPSPDGRHFVRQQGDGPPTMEMFAKPFYRLAGEQIDWQANRSRQLGIGGGIGLEVTNAENGNTVTLDVPRGARVSSAEWSPDGTRIAFFVHTDTETHVYVADPTSGNSRQVTRTPVMATLNTNIAWTPDSRFIVTTLVPSNRGPAPVKPTVPTGPQVRLTTPEENQIRTYPDLLEGPHERDLLEYYTTGQLVVIDINNRRARPIGEPAMISAVDVSPDGMYAHVARMDKPFSYIVPRRQFGSTEEVWNLNDGAVMATLVTTEIRDGAPDDSTNGDPEPRNFSWRPDGQGLSFLKRDPRPENGDEVAEQQDEERPGSQRKDHVMQWLPPFDESSATSVYAANGQLNNVRYSENGEILFLTERRGENTHEYAVFVNDPSTRHTIYRGPGGGGFGQGGGRYPSLRTKDLPNGATAVHISSDGNHVFLSGTEYHDDPMVDGPQSYLERVEIRTGEKERIYESDNNNTYERLLEVLDDDGTRLLVTRESPTDYPDSYIRDVASGQLRQLTENTDYTPDITRAKRHRYEVTRVDGFKLALNVTVPETWQQGDEPLPGMIWFYPREYTGQEDYDESRETYNINRFPNVGSRSMEILVRRGYAVIQPDAPIVGENGRMNDNYVHDLRNNLAAVIDHLDDEGIIDRSRLGVGGHSYGAFSTVNAMTHTPFFKAGIAGDGNYNRTLTPFSFQRERRSLWESKDTYFSMSPLFFANNLNGALLMYHGADDQNVGTFPINSWRLFEALESLGKTSSLYVYPYEDHGPATSETLLDLWGRWTAWLDTYVKNHGAEDRVTTDDGVADDASN